MYTLPTALFIWALSSIGSVHGHVPRVPTPVDDVASSVTTPLFFFNPIADMTACEPATISWIYSPVAGASTELTLIVTNQGVPQPPAPSSTVTPSFSIGGVKRASFRRDDTVTESITNGFINPAEHNYTWPIVNVTDGWYVIQANFPIIDATQNSSSFYVETGSDTSCLGTSTSATSSSPPSTSTSNSSTASPTSSGAGSSSSGGTLPVDAVSSSKVNRGAIAGGVIGGLAVIAAAIAAYFYLRYATASTSPSPRRRGTRTWGGLGSTDSKARTYPSSSRAVGATVDRHHSQSDSVGPMLDNNVYVIGNVGIDSRPSRMNEGLEGDEEVDSYFSPSQEKISSPTHGSPIHSPFSDPGHIDDDAVPLDLITPVPGTGITRNSSTSTSSYMNNNFSRPRSHPSSPYSGSPTTPTASPFSNAAQNTTSSTLGHSDPSTYPPSPSPAYPSGTSQTIAEVPGAPVARRSSQGEPIASGSRRTPRKPVPQYNPTDPALMSPPARTTPLPGAAAPGSDSSSSSREGSMRSGREGGPTLNHKASFGAEGRAVHYLMPDMPPPQRD
ncbi:hypothetical protein B0H11DRAFT_2236210 [Mycena galericulata]|nr:hypothetical protein B0H11DRAFT_2236210 [Mycena galericulata]